MLNTKGNITLKLFTPVKVKLLKQLSDIDPGYLDYPDEDTEVGYIAELELVPGCIYLIVDGRVALSSERIILTEGVDFEFV